MSLRNVRFSLASERPICRPTSVKTRRRPSGPARVQQWAEPLECRAYLSVTLPPASDFPGVTAPAGLVVADLNADGVDDVAMVGVNPTTNLHSVAISLGGAAPVFYDLPGDNSALDIATADFNSDGNVDIAVTDPADGTVSILLGNNDGTFQTPTSTSYGTAQPAGSTAVAYLVAAQLTSGGAADLAVTDPADHKIAILTGNGDGTFTAATPITSSDPFFSPQHIVTADFNSDGSLDLAYNDGTNAQINIATGNNDGTFAAPTAVAVGGAVQGLVADDANSDGQSDLIVSVSTLAGTGEVDVLTNSAGVFTSASLSTTFTTPGPVGVGDIDGDGQPDIVTFNASGSLDLFLGVGDGTFGPAIDSQATTGSPQAVAVTDINGDGKADIVFTEVNSGITSGGGFALVIGPASPEVSPTIAGALPVSLIAGQKTPIVQTLKLANVADAPATGGVSVTVSLSADATFSTDDTIVDSLTVKGTIGLGKTRTQKLKIATIPAEVPAGTYYLVVQATDANGGSATTGSSGTLNVVAPQFDVAGSFKKSPAAAKAGKHLGASITITNTGNIPATGLLPIVVDTSTLNTLDDTAVQALSLSKKINIKPGKSLTIQLSRLIAPATANSYYLIVQLDPGNTLGDVNTANNIFATGAAIVVS